MNSSPLNPDAPVFVPGSVAGADVLLAESPRKPVPMDDIELPDVAQFQTEAVVRPAELLDLDNCDQLNGHHNISMEGVKEVLNGNDKCMDSLGFGFNVGIEPEKGTDTGLIQDFERIQKDTTDFCNIQVFQTHTDTNPFAADGNEKLFERLKNKERDPMSMSFYQEKDDDTCERLGQESQVDLNAVQPLPDSDDDDSPPNGDADDKENVSPQHIDLAHDLLEPNNDIIRFDDRTDLLQNTGVFGQGDNFMDFSVTSNNMRNYSNLEFESNNPQEVAHTDTPESHKLMFEQIPEIPDGKSSELGFTNEDVQDPSESEKDARATPQEDTSQDVEMESKDSPCEEMQPELSPEPKEDHIDIGVTEVASPEPVQHIENKDDEIISESTLNVDNKVLSTEQLPVSPVPEEKPATTPEIAHDIQENIIVDVHQGFETDFDTFEKELEVPEIQFDSEHKTEVPEAASPVPSHSPLPSAFSPVPVESPVPAQPTESPAPKEPAVSPAPPQFETLATSQSPLPSYSPVPAESPLPSHSPLAVQSPPATESPLPAEVPLPRESPLPAESPIPTESLPAASPLPAESPAPTASPLPTESAEHAPSPAPEPSLRTETASPAPVEVAPLEATPAASPVLAEAESRLLPAEEPEAKAVAAPCETQVPEPSGPAPDIVPEEPPRSDLVTDIDIGIPESHAQEICVPVTSEILHEDAVRAATPPPTPAAPLCDTPLAGDIAPAKPDDTAALAGAAVAAAAVAGVAVAAATVTKPKTAPSKKSPAPPKSTPKSTAARTPISARKPATTPAKSPAATKTTPARTPLSAAKPATTLAAKSPAAKTTPAKPSTPAPRTTPRSAPSPAPAKSSPAPIRAPITARAAPAAAKPTKEAVPVAKSSPTARAAPAARPAPKPAAARPATAPAKPAATKPTSRPAGARPASAAPVAPAAPRPKPIEKKPLLNGDAKAPATRPAPRPAPATARPAPRPTPRAPSSATASTAASRSAATAAAPKPAPRASRPPPKDADKQSKDLANKRLTAKAAPPRTAATKAAVGSKNTAVKAVPKRSLDTSKKEAEQTNGPTGGLTNGAADAELTKPPLSPPADNALLPDVIA